jgi:hypothetical protein
MEVRPLSLTPQPAKSTHAKGKSSSQQIYYGIQNKFATGNFSPPIS